MNNTGFDAASYREINEARWRFFEPWIRRLVETAGLRHVIDVGAGAGYFSEKLAALGLSVTATDGRADNVAEIARRYPGLRTEVVDIQKPQALEPFQDADMVFCAGLLYHLDNPVAALRSLGAVAARVMIIETQLIPDKGPFLRLVEEGASDTQGLDHLALVPSQVTLVRLLHLFGWKHVYLVPGHPDHWQFHETRRHHRLRSVFVASREPLAIPDLRLLNSKKEGKGFQEKPQGIVTRLVRKLRGN
ncbi:MAG: methyltransferase domain-containing protein [Vicinamibacterales bacterium]|jgi:SAM-dependent methyltransferase